MTCRVLLKNDNGSYVATVPDLPELRVIAATRQEALSAVREDITRRLAEVEVVELEVGAPATRLPYSPAQLELARKAARLRGQSEDSLTGKPWLDLAGCLSDMGDEYWETYEAALRQLREEDCQREEG
jgi:hypothetical protein